MWIAIDPDHPRRRSAFSNESRARSYADGLTPAWTVRAVDGPQTVPITGTWHDDPDQQ